VRSGLFSIIFCWSVDLCRSSLDRSTIRNEIAIASVLTMLVQASKSELTIRVETTIDGRIIATSVDLPDLQSQAATKEEALADLETKIRARLVTTEIVTLQWELTPKSNPWLEIAGKYAADPEFDRMLAHIATERESIDRDIDSK
jgi:hypothetical protein